MAEGAAVMRRGVLRVLSHGELREVACECPCVAALSSATRVRLASLCLMRALCVRCRVLCPFAVCTLWPESR